MKKLKKLFKKFNNQGSSIVMVIVALAFIGILVGALLTAVGYSYRLKLQDLNARDNFYYVEQAMNEIYAGVGSNTVEDMQEAYTYTVEHMVQYDLATKSYITLNDDEVQNMFTEQFMRNVMSNPFILNQADLGDELEKYISNDTVKLDKDKLYVDYESTKNPDGSVKVTKVIIKNVTLTRTQNYDKSVANGAYTQTISTDIEIGEPDFSVIFNADAEETPNIFGYTMVADMGVEINQPSAPLTITGNVYAASDYYNKKYNESTYNASVSDDDKKYKDIEVTYTDKVYDPKLGQEVDGKVVLNNIYTHGSVTSKKYTDSATTNTYYNAEYIVGDGSRLYFDGVNERSMYSGLFVEDTSVSILADTVIIPGTLAVMDESVVSIYGKDGRNTAQAELWADNIVLGGESSVTKSENDPDKSIYSGATLYLRADAYIKDDTELNAHGSDMKLTGSYYGYGDSTERDTRVFVPSAYTGENATYASNFQIEVTDANGNTVIENRGHYNSSAIIVNGQQSNLNLFNTTTLYLAGRSYIELSKDVKVEETAGTATEGETTEGTATSDNQSKVTETYAFITESDDLLSDKEGDMVLLRDYKTGESISLKSNQIAYIPIMFNGIPQPVMKADNTFAGYWEAELHVGLQGSQLFEKYFPKKVFDNKIPCIMQEVSGKKYYYYDFETAYDMMYPNDTDEYASAQYYASAFIVDYVKELQDEDSVIKEYLKDITDFEDLNFDAGDIILPNKNDRNNNVSIYSSGAITAKSNTEFSIVQSEDWSATALSSLLDGATNKNGLDVSSTNELVGMDDGTEYTSAYSFSNHLEMEYALVKWNLGHFDTSAPNSVVAEKNSKELTYIKHVIQDEDFGEESITPINKFLNMDKINKDISPASYKLKSGNSVWISKDTVTVTSSDALEGRVSGIVISKGDVIFDSSVKRFEGLVVSGGKIYIKNDLATMTASIGTCESILQECMMLPDEDAKYILSIFKGYENASMASSSGNGTSGNARTIDSIDYSDVCRFNNWMKNVE